MAARGAMLHAPAEWLPCPHTVLHLFTLCWTYMGPYSCIPLWTRCFFFSPWPLKASTTLVHSHAASYERYVVCKLRPPLLPHLMSDISLNLSHNASVLFYLPSHTQDREAGENKRCLSHVSEHNCPRSKEQENNEPQRGFAKTVAQILGIPMS